MDRGDWWATAYRVARVGLDSSDLAHTHDGYEIVQAINYEHCVWLFVTPRAIHSIPGQNTGVRSLSLLQGIFPT